MIMLKLFFSKALDIAMRYPLQIILVIVSLYAINQKSQHNAIKRDFEIYKETVEQAGKFRELQNHLMKKQAENAVKAVIENHTKQLEAVKHEYEKRNKTNNLTIAALRSELRDKVSDSFTTPKIDTNTERTTNEWRDSYTAISNQYQTLIDACTITTLDYNALRGWADSACDQVGCE